MKLVKQLTILKIYLFRYWPPQLSTESPTINWRIIQPVQLKIQELILVVLQGSVQMLVWNIELLHPVSGGYTITQGGLLYCDCYCLSFLPVLLSYKLGNVEV